MKKKCPKSPVKKKEYIEAVGKVLVKEKGKKKYYKPVAVKKDIRKLSGIILIFLVGL